RWPRALKLSIFTFYLTNKVPIPALFAARDWLMRAGRLLGKRAKAAILFNAVRRARVFYRFYTVRLVRSLLFRRALKFGVSATLKKFSVNFINRAHREFKVMSKYFDKRAFYESSAHLGARAPFKPLPYSKRGSRRSRRREAEKL